MGTRDLSGYTKDELWELTDELWQRIMSAPVTPDELEELYLEYNAAVDAFFNYRQGEFE